MTVSDDLKENQFLALTIMCRYPHFLIDDRRSDDLKHGLERWAVRTITRNYVTPPFIDVVSRTVTLGWPFVRIVWAQLCGYLSLFEWWEREGEPNSIANFVADPQNAPVLKLFNWALDQAASPRPLPYPFDVPRPPPPGEGPIGTRAIDALRSPDLLGQFEGRVTRGCQRAIGWMILHEIGHLMFGHAPLTSNEGAPPSALPTSLTSMMQEQQADNYASRWLLKWNEADGAGPDRHSVLGVIGAHVSLTSNFLAPAGRAAQPHTHAPPLTRLRRLLLTFLPEHKLACSAASLFLELELWAQNLPSAEEQTFGSDAHLCRIHVLSGGAVV